MSTFVLSLSDSQATLENVGGKGTSLAKLARAGIPVPDGFHITTEAYRQFVAANNLQTKILSALRYVDVTLPATLETASASIGFIAVVNIGFIIAPEFVFNGREGYEATGPIGFILGALIGLVGSGIYLFGRRTWWQ